MDTLSQILHSARQILASREHEISCLNDDKSDFPLISVLVVSFNHGEFVPECLESIVATHYQNLEIIVIDDASTDQSHTVIQNWVSNYCQSQSVHYIHHEKNAGLTRSLNEGIRKASGDFICYISGDDIMLPEGIDVRLKYLKEHPDKLAVFADCHVVNEFGHLIYQSGIEDYHRKVGMRKKYLKIDALIPYNIVFHWAVSGPVFMCRKETFDIVGPYDENLRLEDWDMYLRLCSIGKLGFCNEFVSCWRFHQHNTIYRKDGYLDGMLELTIQKNLHRFKGVQWLRLDAMRQRLHYKRLKTRLRDYIKAKLLLALAQITYRIRIMPLILGIAK